MPSAPRVVIARAIPLALALLFVVTTAVRAAEAPARLLTSDLSGVTFEVDVPAPTIATLQSASGPFQSLTLPGFEADAEVGKPMLPARAFWIAVPQDAEVSITATGEGERVYDGLRVLPQQDRAWAESEAKKQGARALVTDAAAYSRAGYGDQPLATVSGVTGMRAQRVARVTVRPVAYDPSTGRVRVWSRVRVDVHFAGGRPGAAPSRPEALESMYADLLNYESGRAWRSDLAGQTLRGKGLLPDAVATPAGTVRQDFSSSPNWVKLEVTNKGVYKVDAADLSGAGVNVQAIDPRTIRVFAQPGQPVLDQLNAPIDWMNEAAISVVGESDGSFDANDYVLFYGLGSSGWKDEYTPSWPDSDFQQWINHPYETKNFYWLTWGGSFASPPKRWAARDAAPDDPAAWTAPDFTARQHFEADLDYRPNLQAGGSLQARTGIFWEKWIWVNVTDNSGAVPLNFSLPGAVASRPGRVKARLWGNSSEIFRSAGVYDHYLDVSINGQPFAERQFFGTLRQDFDTTFADVRSIGNQFRVQARKVVDPANPNRLDQVALFWYDVDYPRTFTPVANLLDFRSPDTTGTSVAYGVGPFASTAGLLLLDTTDPFAVTQLTGYVERDTTGGKAVYFDDDGTAKRGYLALTGTNLRHPDAVTRVQIDDLRNPTNGADYVVITNDAFVGPASNLATFRSTRLAGVANPVARVVKTSDIYAWYSNGRLDPVAIRNFLYDAVKVVGWAPAPSYVCFLGDASFDYKNIYHLVPQGQPTNWVPTFPNGWQTAQFSTDDWLVDLDLGTSEGFPGGPQPGFGDSVAYDIPDLATGRLPASSLADADFLVDGKVIPYEATPHYGEWRRRGLMLADDITQGFAVDNLSTQHMAESEVIANTLLPSQIEPKKIFLLRYPYGSGSEKPAVNRDVKATLNDGVVFWNFIGHGNPFKMADENAFILSDVGTLQNIDKLTFMVAASCDLGKFDDAIVTGLGESLVKSRAGGVIASFSATDLAFASSNTVLAEQLFSAIFDEPPTGFETPLGEAALRAKNRHSFLSSNDNKYVLMGDPGQRLALPERYVRLRLADATTTAPVDSLKRGQRVTVHGAVSATHDSTASDVMGGFNGVASILVVDAAPKDSVTDIYGKLVYKYDPGVIFHGDATVTGGLFDATFVVPLEALTGPDARVYAYVNSSNDDGGGEVSRPLTLGSSAVVDTTGPTIGLAFVNGLKVVPPDAKLRVVVRDENGVNLTGHTIPNALVLTIDGLTRYDLTKDFRYDAGSYQEGSVEFTLPNLDPGPHSITVSAADNYAQGVLGKKNRSTASIDFEVEAQGAFALGRVYNFPNPFKPGGPGTSFVITGLTESARVVVKVYSVSGTLVRRLETTGGPGQVQLAWDGRDDRGDRVANGAYLYQVAAEGSASGLVVRYRGQAAALE